MPRPIPLPLTRDQIPLLAKCLIGNRLGKVQVVFNTSSNPSVTFLGSGLELVLNVDDWGKVKPVLLSSYWFQPSVVFLDGRALGADLSLIDFSHLPVYERAVADLWPLFPSSFPGSP